MEREVCSRCGMWMYETLHLDPQYRCLCCDDQNNGACPHRPEGQGDEA